jgi:hypothetical protein
MTANPIVLLIASDADVLRSLIGLFPRQHWKPMAARTATQAQQTLQAAPEVAIIHNDLVDAEGPELCVWIRAQAPSSTIVLLTQDLPPARHPQDPFDAAVRYPCAPPVFQDTLQRAYANKYAKLQDQAFLDELHARAALLDQQDYYALLGLPRDATHDLIRQYYDYFSLRYHPDRNISLQNTPAFKPLHDLYKRIGEAYRVLTDAERRTFYDRQLAKGQLRYDEGARKTMPTSLEDFSDNPRAKRYLKMAQTAHVTGQAATALQNLKFALSMDPDNDLLQEKIRELGG